MTDLTSDIYLSQSALSRAVARLEGDGLVHRNMCDNDRRAIFVCLTDAGRSTRRPAPRTARCWARTRTRPPEPAGVRAGQAAGRSTPGASSGAASAHTSSPIGEGRRVCPSRLTTTRWPSACTTVWSAESTWKR